MSMNALTAPVIVMLMLIAQTLEGRIVVLASHHILETEKPAFDVTVSFKLNHFLFLQ